MAYQTETIPFTESGKSLLKILLYIKSLFKAIFTHKNVTLIYFEFRIIFKVGFYEQSVAFKMVMARTDVILNIYHVKIILVLHYIVYIVCGTISLHI